VRAIDIDMSIYDDDDAGAEGGATSFSI